MALPDATMPILPPELTDVIIDYCHLDSRTLAVCSLVCKAWYAGSRYHLFPVIQLSTARKAETFTELIQYRSSSSSSEPNLNLNIAPFLRHLSLHISPESRWLPSFLGALPDYVPLLTLKIFCHGYHLTEEIKTKLARTFRSITYLVLEETTSLAKSMARDVEFVCAFPELRTVLISGDHYRDTVLDVGRAKLPRGVKELKVDLASSATEALMGWLLTHEDVPTVAKLHLFRVNDNRVPALREYIQRCRESLEDLMLFLYQHRTDPADFDLSQHVALKSVYLSASGTESIRTIRDILVPVVASEAHHPRHVLLRISVFEVENVYDWASLDRLLSSNKAPLPRITVVVDKEGGYEHKLMSRLPVCAAQNQLVFARSGVGSATLGYVEEVNK